MSHYKHQNDGKDNRYSEEIAALYETYQTLMDKKNQKNEENRQSESDKFDNMMGQIKKIEYMQRYYGVYFSLPNQPTLEEMLSDYCAAVYFKITEPNQKINPSTLDQARRKMYFFQSKITTKHITVDISDEDFISDDKMANSVFGARYRK